MTLNQPRAESTIYRVRSPTHPNAWYPHVTSIVKSRIERATIKERIETILLSLVDYEPSELKNLNVGFIKPKKVELEDFLTSWTSYVRKSSLNFGNLRGSNLLEYCDILIIVGTYVVNVEELPKDFEIFYHRKPWSTQSEKLTYGGYRYVGDSDLENFRKMCEDYEMYQAVHRVRPALKEKKVYVFGLVPEEIFLEFPNIKDVTFEKDNEGGMRLVEWKNFEKFVEEKIGNKGISQRDLVNAVYEEFGGNKEVIRRKIRKFVAKRNGEYIIVWKEVMGKGGLHVQRR